jgi:hypothetical protein
LLLHFIFIAGAVRGLSASSAKAEKDYSGDSGNQRCQEGPSVFAAHLFAPITI